MIIVLVILSALVASYFLYKFFKKEEKTSPPVESVPVEINEKISDKPSLDLSVLTKKLEKNEESVEEMNKRLSTITNPDADKPFAKISVPEIAEVPNIEHTKEPKYKEVSNEEVPLVKCSESPEISKPKRKYNKKKKS